ncbi:MAG: CobW family GTP-binding protein [Mahellales bacterium]|jgi:G3E family GTPase
MANPLPVILLTGFLGAGKTTVLNELLRFLEPKNLNIGLLINEFGRINIDAQLINEKYSDSIYEVNQGSIFCVCTRDQFLSALDSIIKHTPPFDLMIIEATGIAQTGDLNQYLNEPPYRDKLKITQNICLVDAVNFHKVLATLPAIKNQIQEASLCIINKMDLAKEQQIDIKALERKLQELNPNAPIFKTEYGKLDFANMLNLDGSVEYTGVSGIAQDRPEAIYTYTLVSQGIIAMDDLREFLKTITKTYKDLMRAKGFISTDEGDFYVEAVGTNWHIKPFENTHHGRNRLILTGGKIDSNKLQTEFKTITMG